MVYAILFLTGAGIFAIMYSRYKAAKAYEAEAAIKQEEKKQSELKKQIAETQKEIDNASKNYNDIYDAYKRKYSKSERPGSGSV